MLVLYECQYFHWDVKSLACRHHGPLYEWLTGSFVKVVLAVNSEEELMEIYEKAKRAGLNTVLITDNATTEFSSPTRTCIGIGPDWEEKIDKITGHLKGYS